MENTPVFFTSLVPTSAIASSTWEATVFLISQAAAMASAIPPLDMARAAAAFFIAFIGAILVDEKNEKTPEDLQL